MATTRNIRTWKRRSSDSTLPVEGRVQETSNPADMLPPMKQLEGTDRPSHLFVVKHLLIVRIAASFPRLGN